MVDTTPTIHSFDNFCFIHWIGCLSLKSHLRFLFQEDNAEREQAQRVVVEYLDKDPELQLVWEAFALGMVRFFL